MHRKELEAFAAEKSFRGKGPLCVALVVTQHARTMELPFDSEKLLTEGGGQVLGLGKSAVQSVLKRHGVARVLASEGGRTSRGSLGNMREYVAFLNGLAAGSKIDRTRSRLSGSSAFMNSSRGNLSRFGSMLPEACALLYAT